MCFSIWRSLFPDLQQLPIPAENFRFKVVRLMHLGVELWVAFSLLVTLKHLDLKDLGCVPFQLKDAGPRT